MQRQTLFKRLVAEISVFLACISVNAQATGDGTSRSTSEIQMEPGLRFAENNPDARIVFTRSGDISYPVQLQVIAEDASAEAGRDFVFPPTSITFEPGEVVKEATFTILDNELPDGRRGFRLHLFSENSLVQLTVEAAWIAIHDDEIEVALLSSLSVHEKGVSVKVPVQILFDSFVHGSTPPQYDIEVRAVNGSAVAGRDYLPTKDPFVYEILDNRVMDGNRTFEVELVRKPGVPVGDASKTVITIRDDDNLASHALGPNRRIRASALQSDGNVMVGGDFTFFDGLKRRFIARVNPDGILDESFDPGEGFNDSVGAIVIQPDGRIIVAGEFTEFNGVPMGHIARLHPDGSRDLSFDPGTGWSNLHGVPHVWSLALGANGEIYTGGRAARFDGRDRPGLARLFADGSLDETFDSDITLPNDRKPGIGAIAIEPDQNIIVGGWFNLPGLADSEMLVRFSPEGQIETRFERPSLSGSVAGLLLQLDGKIIGKVATHGIDAALSVAGWLPTGERDTWFYSGAVRDDLIMLSNEIMLEAGDLTLLPINGKCCRRKLEDEFRFPGRGQSLTALGDGTFLVSFTFGQLQYQFGLGRYTTNGPVNNLRFLPPVRGADGAVHLALRGTWQDHVVERSSDLQSWEIVSAIAGSSTVPPLLVDHAAAGHPNMFYRVRRR